MERQKLGSGFFTVYPILMVQAGFYSRRWISLWSWTTAAFIAIEISINQSGSIAQAEEGIEDGAGC